MSERQGLWKVGPAAIFEILYYAYPQQPTHEKQGYIASPKKSSNLSEISNDDAPLTDLIAPQTIQFSTGRAKTQAFNIYNLKESELNV